MLSDFVFYNCGVLAAQLLRSQTKNSPQDCFLNAATVQQEIKFQNFSKFGSYAFGLCFFTAATVLKEIKTHIFKASEFFSEAFFYTPEST